MRVIDTLGPVGGSCLIEWVGPVLPSGRVLVHLVGGSTVDVELACPMAVWKCVEHYSDQYGEL